MGFLPHPLLCISYLFFSGVSGVGLPHFCYLLSVPFVWFFGGCTTDIRLYYGLELRKAPLGQSPSSVIML